MSINRIQVSHRKSKFHRREGAAGIRQRVMEVKVT